MKKKKLRLKKQPFFILIICLLSLFAFSFYQLIEEHLKVENDLVSSEVSAYHDTLTKYAKQNQIEEYVTLLEAMMMQESGGNGLDPMQSSECEFNQQYEKKPNAITEPEYSIQVGVKYFAKCLKKAKVTSLDDKNKIYLALQGYNYGVGYIYYVNLHGGKYTYQNAIDFSNKCKQEKNVSVYGDSKYVYHVLRYYQDTSFVDDWLELYH